MLDDLLELLLDVGGEVLEAVLRHVVKRRRKTGKTRHRDRENRSEQADPWEQTREKPPWEG